jgi:hypothetical protein
MRAIAIHHSSRLVRTVYWPCLTFAARSSSWATNCAIPSAFAYSDKNESRCSRPIEHQNAQSLVAVDRRTDVNEEFGQHATRDHVRFCCDTTLNSGEARSTSPSSTRPPEAR